MGNVPRHILGWVLCGLKENGATKMFQMTTWRLSCVLGLILLAFVAACASEDPSATVSSTATAIVSPPATVSPTATPTPTSAETDREALVTLFNATGGEGWGSNRNWLSDAPLGEWHGVATNEKDRVVRLNLSENGLSGEIPAELGALANLQELLLSGNRLSGEIPVELGNLANLLELELDGNELTGGIPPELGNLARLRGLLLGGNELSGEIPAELENLFRLSTLSLPGNLLSECISDLLYERLRNKDSASKCVAIDTNDTEALVALYNATDGPNWERNDNWGSTETVSEWWGVSTDRDGHLAKLDLSENGLSGEMPPELGNLENLKWLFLWGNELNGEIPAELGNLENLKWLTLGGNELSGEIPTELGNLENLEGLNLHDNQLSGEIPAELGNLANLRELHLDENELNGEIPTELGNLANLERLDLGLNELSGGYRQSWATSPN